MEIAIVKASETPFKNQSRFFKVVDAAISEIGKDNLVRIVAKDGRDKLYFQKCIHTYGNSRGFLMKTKTSGLEIYVSVARPLTDSEVIQRYSYR